jgi:NitT/TauT family transport system permease protein
MVPLRVAALLAVGVLWELLVRVFDVRPILLPGPVEVFRVAAGERAMLLIHARSTLSEIVLAAALAVVGGVATGVIMTVSPLVRRSVFPYIVLTQIVPKVALAPTLILWFGVGLPSRVVLAFLIAYFPMVINTVTGLITVNEAMLHYSRSLAASRWQVFAKVRWPHAVPAVVAGTKITVSVAIIGIIVGEFVASDRGLGRVIMDSSGVLNTPLTIAAVLLVGLIGLVLLGVVEIVERYVVFWRAAQ